MRSLVCAFVLLTLAPGCKKESPFKDVLDTKYRVGQRWNYWARPGEESATFTIEKIESHAQLGEIIHVGLDNIKLVKDKKTVGFIKHLAFSRDAIDKSAAKKIEEDANVPQFQQDYEKWKKSIEEGTGSVIQVTIAEQLNAMEDK